MSTTYQPNLDKYLRAAQQLLLSLSENYRHKWSDFKNEKIIEQEDCYYSQCIHCKKFFLVFIKNTSYISAYFDGNIIANIYPDSFTLINSKICERLNIMT